jgi:hypothetical protein
LPFGRNVEKNILIGSHCLGGLAAFYTQRIGKQVDIHRKAGFDGGAGYGEVDVGAHSGPEALKLGHCFGA